MIYLSQDKGREMINMERTILTDNDFKEVTRSEFFDELEKWEEDGGGYTIGTLEAVNNDIAELESNGFFSYDIADYLKIKGTNQYLILTE